MEKGKRGAWLETGFVMVLCLNIIRRLAVLIFGVTQKGAVLFNAKPWFDIRQLHVAWQMACSAFGGAVMAMVVCMLFVGKREDGESVTRNAAIGTVIGFVVVPIVGMDADIIWWTLIVAILTGGAGFMMGMGRFMVADLYWGFGIVFGAALMLSVTYGFGIAGGLLLLAIGIGVVMIWIGELLGGMADFAIREWVVRKTNA